MPWHSPRVSREQLLTAFEEENIDVRCFFWPLSGLPMFSPRPRNLNAVALSSRAINLPSYHDISHMDMDRVAEVVQELARNRSGRGR
jgi:perosamine synthetase